MYSVGFKKHVAQDYHRSQDLDAAAEKFKVGRDRVRQWARQFKKKPFRLTVLPKREAPQAPYVPQQQAPAVRQWQFCPHCGEKLR